MNTPGGVSNRVATPERDVDLVDVTPVNIPSGAPSPPGAARRVVLVRHGETADNVAGRFLGRSDPALTDRGAEAARRLGPLPAGAVVVSSPARRAIETAALLGAGDPLVDEALREVDFGTWEGSTRDEVERLDPEGYAAFAHGEVVGFPEGETVAALGDRTHDALGRHGVPDLVVVTHATVIRVLVAALLGLPIGRYRALLDRPPNLSWTELEGHAGGWRLVRYAALSPDPIPAPPPGTAA